MSVQTEAAPEQDTGRHVFTEEESSRGRRAAAARRRRAIERKRQKFRAWVRVDGQLWAAYLEAKRFGNEREEREAHAAWREHHRQMPEPVAGPGPDPDRKGRRR